MPKPTAPPPTTHMPFKSVPSGTPVTNQVGLGYHVSVKDHVAGQAAPAPGQSDDYFRWVDA